MNILLILIISILAILMYKNIVERLKTRSYVKAGKKWDNIVKELSRRK